MASSSSLQALISAARRHYPQGNVVSYVLHTVTGGDADLGVEGLRVSHRTEVNPAPYIGAIPVRTVIQSNGAFRYSDLTMVINRSQMTEAVAMNPELRFEVNGHEYKVLVAPTPHPNSWEFVIRRDEQPQNTI